MEQRWQIEKIWVALDANGCGEMIYGIQRERYGLYFVRFANNLSKEEREVRVIAERRDAAVLCEGGWAL